MSIIEIPKNKIMTVTGHRPDKLGGYHELRQRRVVAFAADMLQHFSPNTVITGMALGWDQAVATACLELSIPFWAYCPCKGQELKWPEESQRRYRDLLAQAAKVLFVEERYSGTCMQRRNEVMVDEGDYVVALWNGSEGGTANCVLYAQTTGKPIFQVWKNWQRRVNKEV